jgi:hypothetical protein
MRQFLSDVIDGALLDANLLSDLFSLTNCRRENNRYYLEWRTYEDAKEIHTKFAKGFCIVI